MITELSHSRHKGPRKKFRGQARYFRKVFRKAKKFSLRPEVGDWWDQWHYHADWPGWGNLKWSYRVEHLRALAEVFRTIAQAGGRFSVPFQCWMLIQGCDAGQDATFLHSPNPNIGKFPYIPECVDWDDDRLLPLFQKLLPEYAVRVGHVRWFNEDADDEPPRDISAFFVYSPEVGLPLEGNC